MTDIDQLLMQRVAQADEKAVLELYDRFGALVFKSCLTTLRVRAEAEDAAQDVFVQIWRTADKYDPQRAKLVTWVMLITRRCLIDRLRRKKVRPTMAGLTPKWPTRSAMSHRRSLCRATCPPTCVADWPIFRSSSAW